MEDTSASRVGIYVKIDTRNKLNVYKAQLSLAQGGSVSQDEAINYLLDKASFQSPGGAGVETEPQGE